MNKPQADPDFEALLVFLQRSRGFDFTGYKRPSLMRRVLRRMQELGLESFRAYGERLEAHPEEFGLLFNTILINVTSFFRDPPAWEFLAGEVLPAILSTKGPEAPLRAWSAGCASGQEAYSLAMLLAEALGEERFRQRVKIYATDVDDEALAQARAASYSAKQMESVPAPRRSAFFQPGPGRWQFRSDLRRAVIFGRHDLVQDAPISRLDLILCRNTLMYFNARTQARILAKFHFALNGDGRGRGVLFLGRAEMLLTHERLFTPLDLKFRVFSKVASLAERERPAPASRTAPRAPHEDRVRMNEKLRTLALEESPLARIVVDANGNLALANQRARLVFGINPRDIGRTLSDLEISYRPVELRALIEQAYAERRAVAASGIERRFADGERQVLDVVVTPLFDERQNAQGASVSFIDVTRITSLQEDLRAAREGEQTTHEELQASNEELETTNEELQSSNEELETTNEELQSTNEELETMNEELQSTNEEMQAVNEELRRRTDELHRANSFLSSVLGSLPGGAIAVDRDLNVVVWNHRAEDLWGLREDEVRGKSLLNLDIGLPVAELRAPVRACLQDGTDGREAILDAVNRRGKAIRCRVTCSPLGAIDGKRDGVVLLMSEETEPAP